MLGCVYLVTDLSGATWLRFGIWMVLGLVVYVVYSMRSSAVGSARNPSRTDG